MKKKRINTIRWFRKLNLLNKTKNFKAYLNKTEKLISKLYNYVQYVEDKKKTY